jgi:hypothetical protein
MSCKEQSEFRVLGTVTFSNAPGTVYNKRVWKKKGYKIMIIKTKKVVTCLVL